MGGVVSGQGVFLSICQPARSVSGSVTWKGMAETAPPPPAYYTLSASDLLRTPPEALGFGVSLYTQTLLPDIQHCSRLWMGYS